MRIDFFSEKSVLTAYRMAAENSASNFAEFVDQSKVFNFAVSALGAGLSMNVECDTGLPVSTPAELREKKFQQKLAASQKKANAIADRQRRVAEALAKKMTRKMRKEQQAK